MVRLRTRKPRMTVVGIARILGRSRSAVSWRLARLGVIVRPKAKNGELEKLVKRLYRRGRSDTEIGRRIGRSREAVAKVRRRLGLPNQCDRSRVSRKAWSSRSLPRCWNCDRKAPVRQRLARYGWAVQYRPECGENEVLCPGCGGKGMTLEEAKKLVHAGTMFGDVYPMLATEEDRQELKDWFVHSGAVPVATEYRPQFRRADPGTKNGKPRPAGMVPKAVDTARSQGYTGNVCGTCGGVRMKNAGACEVCEDCGTSGGCG